ncbi:hypothetical protein [Nocardiopsis halotolerans]|uniref:hypothetical protein n=1 Tax=Nocardiopsis halotolerans TaxID=124252 RepID=UPI00034D082C|nr:hypothetical protein [Nocardiopsis halotolerans]
MSVVMLLGAGALIGLVAFTAIVIVALLTEEPEPRVREAPADTAEPARTQAGERSVAEHGKRVS